MESVKDNGGWIKAVIWCDSSVLLNWTASYPRRADEAASCHSKRTTVTKCMYSFTWIFTY